MLTPPVKITINSVEHTLSLINQDGFSSVYLKKLTNEEIRLTIRHSYEGKAGLGQMERHNMDLLHTVWDPATGNSTVSQTYSVTRLPRGADVSGPVADAKGLAGFLTANISSVVSWES